MKGNGKGWGGKGRKEGEMGMEIMGVESLVLGVINAPALLVL